MKTIREELFSGIDFGSLVSNDSFNEASVREFIISPMLSRLGYSSEDIILERGVQVQTGTQKHLTLVYADYILRRGGELFCVIEAKSPRHNVDDAAIIEQAFSYASHSSVRSEYFAICNGVEFSLYKTDVQRTLLFRFSLIDIDDH